MAANKKSMFSGFFFEPSEAAASAPGKGDKPVKQSSAPGKSDRTYAQTSASGKSDKVTPQSSASGKSDKVTPQKSAPGKSDKAIRQTSAPGKGDKVTPQTSAPGKTDSNRFKSEAAKKFAAGQQGLAKTRKPNSTASQGNKPNKPTKQVKQESSYKGNWAGAGAAKKPRSLQEAVRGADAGSGFLRNRLTGRNR